MPVTSPLMAQSTPAIMPASTTFILLVDPDEFLQEMIESGFQLFNPEWMLLKADDPATAHMLLEKFEVEAAITEIEFGDSLGAGLELVRYLEESVPELPTLILTATPPEDVQGFTSADLIAKPPDMDYLIGKVHRAIQRKRESILRGIALESFLQMLEHEKKTCTLTVISDNRFGHLFVREGRLVHAEAGAARPGRAAAFEILSWRDYSIRLVDECRIEATLDEKLGALLMEWAVHQDHASHERAS